MSATEEEIGTAKPILARIAAALDAGADINAPDEYGGTPLLAEVYWAAIWGGDPNLNFA